MLKFFFQTQWSSYDKQQSSNKNQQCPRQAGFFFFFWRNSLADICATNGQTVQEDFGGDANLKQGYTQVLFLTPLWGYWSIQV